MGKVKVFSFVRVSPDSIVASVRIARFVSEILGDVPVCWDETINDHPLDALIIVGGAYAFAKGDTLFHLGQAIERAGQVIWIQNDFTVIPPKDESGAESPFRKAFRDRYFSTGRPSVSFWTTVDVMSRPGIAPSGHLCGEYSTYINWNALAMDPVRLTKPWAERACPDAILYYGSYRKDREKYFMRYFSEPRAQTFFSCPTKKAEEMFPNLIHETKLESLYEYLGEFGLGLYLEDRKSHTEFHSPANRFYEMLSSGLPIVFQPEAQRMMGKAGYDISQYILWNADEGPAMLARREEMLLTQRSEWFEKAVEEREGLTRTLREAWGRLGITTDRPHVANRLQELALEGALTTWDDEGAV